MPWLYDPLRTLNSFVTVAHYQIREIKSWRKGRMEHTACIGNEKCIKKFWTQDMKRKDILMDLGIDG
jgi:hypothetical protein